MNNHNKYYIIVLKFIIISYKDMCFLFGEDDNGKCGRYWDNYIYIYIDYMGYIGEDDNGKCGRYWDNYIYIYILIIWDT